MTKLVDCVTTGCKLPECVARDVDVLYKTLPQGCEYRTKAVQVEYQFEPGEAAEVSIISSQTVDKTNEVVLLEHLDLEAYRKSMVVLWNHSHDRGPVAKCAWVKLQGDTLRAKTVYPEDLGEFTKECWVLTKGGALKAKSIGFLPRTPQREPTEQELQVHPEWKGAGIWDDTLMLEYSVCNYGINNDSLVELVNTKSLNSTICKSLGVDLPIAEVLTAIPECHCHKTKTYTQAELNAVAALAYQKGKSTIPVKPKVDVNKLIAKALNSITLDTEDIVRKAVAAYRNRGRV